MVPDIRAALERDARAFLSHARKIAPQSAHSSHEAALERLTKWSVQRSPEVDVAPSVGADPLVGVSAGADHVLVWRVFPRRSDGGKVTLLPGSNRAIDPDARDSIAEILAALQPGATFEAGKQLEIALDRIASDTQWQKFEQALEIALARTNAAETDRSRR